MYEVVVLAVSSGLGCWLVGRWLRNRGIKRHHDWFVRHAEKKL